MKPIPLAPAAPCPVVTDPAAIAERYAALLGDESRLRAAGVAAIYLPRNTSEVAGALAAATAAGERLVISAGRTGIAGGAVPIDAEAILSLGALNHILALETDREGALARLEPGVSLADLAEALRTRPLGEHPAGTFWFPVDPTETTAHVGGVVSTNASGARSYRYGPIRPWVSGLTVLLPTGHLLRLRRGEVHATDGALTLPLEGGEVRLTLPGIPLPPTKATLGYPLAPGMDLIDLFVGSEGTLGVILEVELRLAPRPASILGVLAVMADEAQALTLVEAARAEFRVRFDAIEYFDPETLRLLKAKRDAEGNGSHIPDLPRWEGAAVYLEFSGSEAETEAACEPLEEILAAVGSSLDATWAALEPHELEAQKTFRHAVPEAVNAIIGQRKAQHPGLHKVGTDMAVPDAKLREVFALYRAGIGEAGIDSVIFGHIGNNHLHVNLLPEDMAALARAKALYQGWADSVVAMGGAVAAEHGIGRIKKGLLARQFPAETLEAMRAIRRALDPQGRLAPGVLV